MEANMGRNGGGAGRLRGLILRGITWHLDKEIRGIGRVCQSTGESDYQAAEEVALEIIRRCKEAIRFGVRPTRTFREAATKFLEERLEMDSVGRDAQDLRLVEPYIGDLPLPHVHDSTLEKFIADRKQAGKSQSTINRTLTIVQLVLRRATEWRDEHHLSWLAQAPKITKLNGGPRRKPYPLDWDEQALLFSFLAPHQEEMSIYTLNTASRSKETCLLEWAWEEPKKELGITSFRLPAWVMKNGEEKVVVLNRDAKKIVDAQRGKHPKYVFTYDGHPVKKIYNSGWKRARQDAAAVYEERLGRPCPEGFRKVRVHDLRHTAGRRLRAAGVDARDCRDILGHKGDSITRLYTDAEYLALFKGVEMIRKRPSRKSPAVR
jgi:integrase